MTKEERLGLAREYFRRVLFSLEDSLDDEVYEVIDPENEFGTELIEEFNLGTINEVLKLGFKAKYGEPYDAAEPDGEGHEH